MIAARKVIITIARRRGVLIIETLFGDGARIMNSRQFRLLLLANINAALGTVLVSPLLEALTGPFAVSDVRIGLLITAFTAPPVIGIPVIGAVADRWGRKPVLIAGLALFGTAGGAVGLAHTFEVALALRVLQGVGYSGITPIIITAIGDLYSGTTEATAQGLRFTSSGAAQGVFPLLAGLLVGLAWQYPFYLYLMAVPIAALVWMFFEETAVTPNSPAATEPVPDGGAGQGCGSYFWQLVRLVVQSKVASVLVAFGVAAFLYIAFLTYNSFLIVRVLGATPGVAGMFITVVSVVYAITASQAGRVTAYFSSRAVPLVVANLLMGGGLAATAVAPSIIVAVTASGVMGIGIGLAFSLLRSVLTGLAPEQFRGGLVGVGESVIRLANSLAPITVGAIVTLLTGGGPDAVAIRHGLLIVGIGAAVIGSAAMAIASVSRPVTTP